MAGTTPPPFLSPVRWQFVRALCITLSAEILRIRNAFACLARILWATATAAATTATTKLTTLARCRLISYVVYPKGAWQGHGDRDRDREVRQSTTNNFDFLTMVSIINEPQIHKITRLWTQSICVCVCVGCVRVCVCVCDAVCVCVCVVPISKSR